MQEQTRLLAQDHGEWIFLTDSEDDDEAERVWKSDTAALAELRQECWHVIQGPVPVRFDMEGLERFDLKGFRLRRRIQ